ncbi:hypothetical protein ASE75_05745 [Sphingomonas sp. Leaf17]|nr:hypothetical protein ASE75_05745 [Sphingomonas sp. Leaf17]
MFCIANYDLSMTHRRPSRGATSNIVSGRFALAQVEADGDWLDARADLDEVPPPLRTTVTVEHPKTIITRNTSPDVPFDRSINPYRGCDQPRNGYASVRRWWNAGVQSRFGSD